MLSDPALLASRVLAIINLCKGITAVDLFSAKVLFVFIVSVSHLSPFLPRLTEQSSNSC